MNNKYALWSSEAALFTEGHGAAGPDHKAGTIGSRHSCREWRVGDGIRDSEHGLICRHIFWTAFRPPHGSVLRRVIESAVNVGPFPAGETAASPLGSVALPS